MPHIFDRDLTADKIMWDTREERANEYKSIFSTITPYPFNHEIWYESKRNRFSIAASNAFNNDTRRKIWAEGTAFQHVYHLYMQGQRSELELKAHADKALAYIDQELRKDRANVTD